MNLILLTVLSLLTTNTVQNLIRHGDFQNIVTPPIPIDTIYNYYGTDIWFPITATHIQLMHYRVPPAYQYTILVDTQTWNNFKLCQNFSAVEIGKTYEYTFDMFIWSQHTSCSIWVILNGNIIDGSNYTSKDHVAHTAVGYINLTQYSNTICF